MKFALIFLSAFVVISQQFQRPRGMRWMPYQRFFNSYQPDNYGNVGDYEPFIPYYRPANPFIYSSQDPPDVNTDEFPDAESRMKGFSRFRPSLMDQQANPRFLFNMGMGGMGMGVVSNPFMRMIQITLTSTVNITSVQSCIPGAQFNNAAAQAKACRRRKREVLDTFNDELDDESGDMQFSIQPSETQKVISTAFPDFTVTGDNLPLSTKQTDQHDIISSKDEPTLDDRYGIEVSQPQMNQLLREKRLFFNNAVATSTLTSYSFVTIIITKTVSLITAVALPAAPSKLACLPAGYVVCA